jgi:nucleotide-binding universal stress UspA family protein
MILQRTTKAEEARMSYVRLMVVQELDAALDDRLRIACGIAHRLDTQLIGITAVNLLDGFGYDPIIASESMTDHRERLEARVRVAEEAFGVEARSWQLTGIWRMSLAHGPTEFVLGEARSADLIITGAGRSSRIDPADLIMTLGRPVLVVPSEAEGLRFKTAIVAWKETRESRRAVADSLPLLRAYQTVHVIEIAAKEELEKARRNVADVADWLKLHGVSATSAALEPVGATSVQLAERAFIEGADLIVAGAYGHTRLREWVLGGVTRDLLTRIPCCSLLSR